MMENVSVPEQPIRLAIPMGDPAGIGPEVVLKVLADSPQIDCNMTVFGDRSTLEHLYDQLKKTYGTDYAQQYLAHPDNLSVIEPDSRTMANWSLGCPSAQTGAVSFEYLRAATAATLAQHYDGIVTGPIAKAAWKTAGHEYPGQTEFLAEQSGVQRFGMLFVANSPFTQWQLRSLLATTHIPLRQVSNVLCPELLSLKLGLLIETLRDLFGIREPRIAIAGLNPHSGEQGQLGTEEIDWLIPWVNEMRAQHPQTILEGPIPPDTLWVKPGQAWFRDAQSLQLHDAYLALYHDQGLIPVKLMAFDRAVNTTIGLPFVRTSPDHGTAFNIAGRGIADATSMKAALTLAQSLCNTRRLQVKEPSSY